MSQLPTANAAQQIPIHVITGFLGSGKTTLLNHLLHQPGLENTAVIVNEFGEIGIDHLLVEASDEDIRMLAGGCLCCAVRSDLVTTLEDLYQRQAQGEIKSFEQVLIETSGMADPAPILRTLLDDEFVSTHYHLDTVVTTVDAVYGEEQMAEHDESAKQAALASHLVLTKTDVCEAAALDSLRQRLQRVNPAARLHDRQTDTIDANSLFRQTVLGSEDWLQAELYRRPHAETHAHHEHTHAQDHHHEHGHKHEHHAHQHDDDAPIHKDNYIRSFCIEREQPIPWKVLDQWIKHMTRLRGKDLLRVKGVAYTCETDLPVLIQGVQHIFQPPSTLPTWPQGEKRSQLVFITRNIEQSLLERSLEALWKSKNAVDACQAAMILLEHAGKTSLQ